MNQLNKLFILSLLCMTGVSAMAQDDEASENAIVFADDVVKNICVNKWDTNGDGELSYAEAAAVTSIGGAFRYNTSIYSFNELQYFTGVTYIGDNAFYGCSDLISIAIPNSVTRIGQFAFTYCSSLTFVTIPNSVTIIGSGAFAGCGNLRDLTIPNSVTNIGDQAFESCSSLTAITIPNSVTNIRDYAFMNCKGLVSVTIGNNVTSIGKQAFYGCNSLAEVRSYIEQPFTIENNVFQYIDNGTKFTSATLIVPYGTKADYETTDGWKNFKNIEEMEPVFDWHKFDVNDDGTVDVADIGCIIDAMAKMARQQKADLDE